MATVTVAGIELSSDAPLFLTALGFHVLAGMACVGSGALAMLSRKQPGRHPRFGTIYYWCLAVVFLSSSVLSALRWTEDYPLFILGALAFAAASIGRTARRRRRPGWARIHIAGMGVSYIVLLTAFYVATGNQLPFWRDLSPVVYWVLPSLIGVPFIVYALSKYRLKA